LNLSGKNKNSRALKIIQSSTPFHSCSSLQLLPYILSLLFFNMAWTLHALLYTSQKIFTHEKKIWINQILWKQHMEAMLATILEVPPSHCKFFVDLFTMHRITLIYNLAGKERHWVRHFSSFFIQWYANNKFHGALNSHSCYDFLQHILSMRTSHNTSMHVCEMRNLSKRIIRFSTCFEIFTSSKPHWHFLFYFYKLSTLKFFLFDSLSKKSNLIWLSTLMVETWNK